MKLVVSGPFESGGFFRFAGDFSSPLRSKSFPFLSKKENTARPTATFMPVFPPHFQPAEPIRVHAGPRTWNTAVHPLISAPRIVENRKMENLRGLVKESHSRAYGCAQRVGAKFGTLAERVTLHRCSFFQKALNASTCINQASACLPTPTSDAPDVNSQLHTSHGKAKTHMAGLSTLPSLHFIPLD